MLILGIVAGHFLWPVPPDPRAGKWLAQEASYRGKLKAQEREIILLRDQLSIATVQSGRTFAAGKRVASTVLASLDSLSRDSQTVKDCRTLDLRPIADSLRLAVLMYDSAHAADSTRIAIQHRIIVTLEDRVRTADSLIASARPIIADARQRSRWGLGFSAGYGCGQHGCGPTVTAGVTYKI